MPPVACYGHFSRSPRAFLAFLGHLLCRACESTAVFGPWRALACHLPAMRRNGATTYSSQSTYVIAFRWLVYTQQAGRTTNYRNGDMGSVLHSPSKVSSVFSLPMLPALSALSAVSSRSLSKIMQIIRPRHAVYAHSNPARRHAVKHHASCLRSPTTAPISPQFAIPSSLASTSQPPQLSPLRSTPCSRRVRTRRQ